MKVIDCFLFFNELEILLFRLTELNDIVDYFVIVEATYTYSGSKKDLIFEKNKESFKKFNDKIIYIVVEDMPNTHNAWDNEIFQRNCIDRGLKKIDLNDDDIIIISDCDEICNSDKLLGIKHIGLNDIYKLEMDLYYYNLTCKSIKYWYYAKILPYKKYKQIVFPEKIRHINNCKIIKNGGWHISYFGNIEKIQTKLSSFSHQEFNNENYKNKEFIVNKIKNFSSLFDKTNTEFSKIEIENNKNLPKNYKMLLQFNDI